MGKGFFSNLLEKIDGLGVTESSSASSASDNPFMPVISKHAPDGTDGLELIGAKLGFIMCIVYADGKTTESEKAVVKELIDSYLKVQGDTVMMILNGMLEIEQSRLEFYYLAKVVNDGLDFDERKAFLGELFKVAHADGEYDHFEAKDMRIISDFLHLSHEEFVEVRKQSSKS